MAEQTALLWRATCSAAMLVRRLLRSPSPALSRRWCAIGTLSLVLFGSVGCGAPWFSLFGAYFPAWMLCGLIGVIGAVIARLMAVAMGLDAFVRLRLLTYGSLGLLLALGTWQCGFGP